MKYILEKDGVVHCKLCPHKCTIQNGSFGICGVRGNKSGRGITPFYGFVSALAIDPIEKKPLYHFKPRTKILSLGFAGCNLRCPFCQNWHISQSTDIPGRYMKPEEVISECLRAGTPSIAYTYSEPLIHFEFLIDCMTLARKHGIANVLVTNGCINTDGEDSPAKEILKLADAANVDLKCFNEDTYKKVLKGNLQTVLDFIKLAYKLNVHLEVTTLIVPELNNINEELESAAKFIASIENENETDDRPIPWHLTAYHPEYRWNAPPTDRGFLLHTAENAKRILKCVHTGNI